MEQYILALKKHWLIIFIVVVFTTVFSFGASLIQTPKYKASVKVLIIQKQANRMDAYTASRSAQAIGEVLSKVVYTSSFFDQVMQTGFKIEKEQFSKDIEKREKEWKEMISASVIDEAGTVQINVFHFNQKQAEQIAYAITYVMVTNGSQYHGGGEQIEIKMIDAPIVSKKPVKPDILQNTIAGFILGFLVSASVIILLASKTERKKGKEIVQGKI
ncbi:MAG: Wzz/FepE/Etk N-terminal domain-containing protein [Patescibacteria group bacterium]